MSFVRSDNVKALHVRDLEILINSHSAVDMNAMKTAKKMAPEKNFILQKSGVVLGNVLPASATGSSLRNTAWLHYL